MDRLHSGSRMTWKETVMREEYAFTPADVVAQIRALAAERPDYTYRPVNDDAKCSYVTGRDGQGCLVGQALMRLGVPEEVLEERETEDSSGVSAREMMQDLLGRRLISYEVDWVDSVQDYQDIGKPWGEAVATVDQIRPPWVPTGEDW